MRRLLFLLFPTLSFASDQEIAFTPPQLGALKKQIRTSAIESMDKILAWTFQYHIRSFIVSGSQETITLHAPGIWDFEREHGFFSEEAPLIATVTSNPSDIKQVENLYQDAAKELTDLDTFHLAWVEITTKILAYRELKENMILQIPTIIEGKVEKVSYKVEKRFDLWQGMPAFGLVPSHPNTPPLLLFRGTDPSFSNKWGWASMVSDLDPKGPGLSVFQRAKEEITLWLKSHAEKGHKARVLGYSLGGVLTTYTVLYLSEYLSDIPSIACNPPGVSKQVHKFWHMSAKEKNLPLKTYVTQGDLVSKIGLLVGQVYELSSLTPLAPIAAHVTPITFGPVYKIGLVDVDQENSQRKI